MDLLMAKHNTKKTIKLEYRPIKNNQTKTDTKEYALYWT